MTGEEYKKLSLKEFDQAAEKFDDNDPSVYNMCRRDYPDVLAETVRESFSDLLDAGCENLPFAAGSFDVVTCSMSFYHYPNPEKFFASLHRVLRPGGRFILRDMASNSRVLMWFMNHIEIPIANKVMHKGDVHVYAKSDIQKLCDASGMVLELYEVRRGFRLHCVVRKPV